MTDYSTTETTDVEYDNAGRVTKTTVVTEYTEHEPTIKPEGITAPPEPYVIPNTYNPHLYNPNIYPYVHPGYVWPSPNKYEVFCTANASVYDLDHARARKTS